VKFSIVIPTYNEEKFIAQCLDSIAAQTLVDEVEVLIVDDNSTDNTVDMANMYKFVRILKSGFKDPEMSKKIGLDNASGRYFQYLDADMVLADATYLEEMSKPLERHLEVTGVLAKFCPAKEMNALTRYISYDEFQRDTFLRLFTPSIKEEPGADFYEFSEDFMPCQSLILYRTEILKEVLKDRKHFMDNDVVVLCVKAGYKYFAYCPQVGVFHFYFNNIGELWHKRVKGVNNSYLPNIEKREYKWINFKKKWPLLLGWVIWANLFVPELIKGTLKSLKYMDACFFYEPIVSWVTTNSLIVATLRGGVKLNKIMEKI
jgi:glycosyltransferase involved in cell wall biosynthesis